MSREELKAYLQAQLDEIRRYYAERARSEKDPLEFRRALEEWIDANAAAFQEAWLSARRIPVPIMVESDRRR